MGCAVEVMRCRRMDACLRDGICCALCCSGGEAEVMDWGGVGTVVGMGYRWGG